MNSYYARHAKIAELMAYLNKKGSYSLDTYLSILAVISSFCAIGITVYQAYLQRVQQYASVMPIMNGYNTSSMADGSAGYAFVIINNGLGPAFIKDVVFSLGDKSYKSVSAFSHALLNTAQINDSTSKVSDIWKGRVIAQGERFSLIESRNKNVEKILRENLNRAEMRILYKSVYGETWLFTYNNNGVDNSTNKID